MIVELILGLAVLMYMAYTAFTMYFVMIGKKAQTDFIGKVIWYHGVTWIIGVCVIALFTLSIIMANFISHALHLYTIVGS